MLHPISSPLHVQSIDQSPHHAQVLFKSWKKGNRPLRFPVRKLRNKSNNRAKYNLYRRHNGVCESMIKEFEEKAKDFEEDMLKMIENLEF